MINTARWPPPGDRACEAPGKGGAMTDQLIPTDPPLRCSPEELRTLFLFEKLSDEQLDWLCENGWVKTFQPGPVYTEGEPATCFYVLIDGTVVLSRRVGPDDVETTRTSQPGVYAGAWRSYLGDRAPDTYNNSMRVTEPSRFFVLDSPLFAKAMRDWFPMAVHMLEGLFYGMQSANDAIGQRERLLALGSLSAGLTHELNNPASAAVRATAALRERVAGMRHKLALIASGRYTLAFEPLIALQEEAAALVAKAPTMSPIEASDAEDEIGGWLEEREITAPGMSRRPSCRPASTCRGWSGSPTSCPTTAWTAPSSGSTTRSRQSC